MKWLLIIFILVDGEWMAADYAVPDWKPMEFATEAACKDVEELATATELRMQEEHPEMFGRTNLIVNPDGDEQYVIILPRKFECLLRFTR